MAETETKDHVCVPVDVEVFGFGRPRAVHPPFVVTDELVSGSDWTGRAVLRPRLNHGSVALDFGRGRQLVITAWANKTGIGPQCVHEARRKEAEDTIDAMGNFVKRTFGNDAWVAMQAHVREWLPEYGCTKSDLETMDALR